MKQEYFVASFSGGKDSTAMVLRMIELGERIDEVVFCDTYLEFPAMYRHVEKVKKVVEDAGIKFTTLKSDKTFEYLMFDKVIKSKDGGEPKRGYSWPRSRYRWCTSKLKVDVVNKYFREMNKHFNVVQCVGIAADEGYRLERKSNQQEKMRHPLVEWGWTEADCLEYCYGRGYDWEGLYRIFERVSCWCCPIQPLSGLRKLWEHFPELWEQLLEMDKRARSSFGIEYSVEELEIRFRLEKEMAAQGLPTGGRTKVFREALKQKLDEHRSSEKRNKEGAL